MTALTINSTEMVFTTNLLNKKFVFMTEVCGDAYVIHEAGTKEERKEQRIRGEYSEPTSICLSLKLMFLS